MKIEVGGVYRTREGGKVKILSVNELNEEWPFTGDNGATYTISGSHMFSGREGSQDIISEWFDTTTPPKTFLSSVEQLGLEYGMVIRYYEASDDGCTVSFEVDV